MKNKKLIRLTEADLHRIVRESVNKVIRQSSLCGRRMRMNEVSADLAKNALNKTLDDLKYGDLGWDARDKRARQADTFAKYAQDKDENYYPFGLIGWEVDESDGVFDRSRVVYSDEIDDIPDYGYGIYALTREGKDIYERWCDDASAGYSLGNGRMKGLADEIGGVEWNIWEYLTSHKHLSRKIKY